MVRQFAKTQGFDAAIGRTLEVKDGMYTGRIMYNNSRFPISGHLDKVEILQHYLSEHDIHADLSQSYAVGDSEGDIALLSAVGRPIAFNPSLPLAKIAQKKGWEMVVERKDVIYNIRETSFIPHEERQLVRLNFAKRKH